ncbi:uncharacterized protein LOC111412578 [Olea europaea var. sylvestris]|uniref:uncharacterized protein LOC111412578 n=1 Tax=Olea europaea var. sylvestris TaxID=158386 RepID=UPI000C1D7533|nr:uncharacterized protein LOC111412578 [Olea europaea var. sylvestris]
MTRFNKERLQIPDLHITAAVSALTYTIRCEVFKMSLSKTPPQTVIELLNRAEKYINKEEMLNPRRAGYEKIKVAFEDKVPPDTRDRSKYCEFHRDHGHTMEDCQALQREIEALIKRGFLKNYIDHDKRPRHDRDNRKEPGAGSSAQPTVGTINIIVGGIASGGDISSGRKQYALQHAHTLRESSDEVKDITFGARDLEGISYPHDDALVFSAVVANFEVKRILIDNGSAANILSQEAFAKMGISQKQLKVVKTLLQGFGGGVIIPEGIIELPLTLGSGHGIGVVRGNETAARLCYVTSIRGMSTDVMQLSDLELEPRDRLAPVEELKVVKLEHRKAVTIGRDLQANLREEILNCLPRNIDVFAWKVEDMPGIDPEFTVYRLNISPGAKPVK